MKFQPTKLKGTVIVPASKSYTHRAIIAASLAKGESRLENVYLSEDIETTIKAMKDLGAEIKGNLTINGGSISKKKDTINFNESGSTMRFVLPLCLLDGIKTCFRVKPSLLNRPLDDYYKIFDEQGIEYGTNPLYVKGILMPGDININGNVSSQFVSGLLIVLPLLDKDSVVNVKNFESRGYVEMTMDVLAKFGIKIIRKGNSFLVKGNQQYKPCNYHIEGDYSQASFWIVANKLGSDINIKGLSRKTLQPDSAINKMLDLDIIDIKDNPDLGPIMAVYAALNEGKTTRIINAGKLRYKESNRLLAIQSELQKLGAKIVVDKDELVITGVKSFKGGIVDSWNDHRIAMSLAIASIKCEGTMVIKRMGCIKKSYPSFVEDFKRLGGIVDE